MERNEKKKCCNIYAYIHKVANRARLKEYQNMMRCGWRGEEAKSFTSGNPAYMNRSTADGRLRCFAGRL